MIVIIIIIIVIITIITVVVIIVVDPEKVMHTTRFQRVKLKRT